MRDFYSSKGENATYYMRNIDEIDYLMQTGSTILAGRSEHNTINVIVGWLIDSSNR